MEYIFQRHLAGTVKIKPIPLAIVYIQSAEVLLNKRVVATHRNHFGGTFWLHKQYHEGTVKLVSGQYFL